MKDLTFNKLQRKIIESPLERNIVVTGGASSGKTTLLIQRIVHVNRISPNDHIIVLTNNRSNLELIKYRL